MKLVKFPGRSKSRRTYGQFNSIGLITKRILNIVRWKDGNLSITLDDRFPYFVINEKDLLAGIKKIPKQD